MFLEIKNLSKAFEDKKAVDNLNFSINSGEILCILGPSGCGKTTVLNMIGGFIKPDKGKILLQEKDITNLPPELRDITTVFQSYGLFPHKNVIENIKYGLKFKNISKKEKEERVKDIIKKVNLEGYESKRIDNLSGGQQQRVAIARSLVVRPKLLLLDEPFSNLDANLKITMRKEVKNIQKKFNVTTIFVTHDQEDAFSVADKVLLINEGKKDQFSDPETLYNKPDNPFVLNFIGKSTRLGDYYIRPEKVKLSKQNPNSKIISRTFKGSFIEYEIKLEKGQIIKAINLNDGNNFNIGENVKVEYILEKLVNKNDN